MNKSLKLITICIAIAGPWLACSSDDSDDRPTLSLSGLIEAPLELSGPADVIVTADLAFNGSGLLSLSGDLHFFIPENFTFELPPETSIDPESDLHFSGRDGAAWQALNIQDHEFSIQSLTVEDALGGLALRGNTNIAVEELVLKANPINGLRLLEDDILVAGRLELSDSETGLLVRSLGRLEIQSGRIESCGTGAHNDGGVMLISNCLISDCSEYGIMTDLEQSTRIENCNLESNYTQLWIQNYRNIVFSDNNLSYNTQNSQDSFPIVIVHADESYPIEFYGNNIEANTANRYINMGGGILHAENNWWGTTDSLAIQAGMYDGYEEIGRGFVSFSPYALSANQAAGIH